MRIITFLFCLTSISLFAGGITQTVGAIQAGMADASLTQRDVFAVNYNIAGISFLEKPSVGIYADRKFLLANLNFFTISVASPVKKMGSFGGSFSYFGNNLYSESQIGAGYARQLGDKVALGVKFDYLRLAIAENGSKNTIAFGLGMQVKPLEKLRLAAHVYNPIPLVIESQQKEKLNTTFKVGLAYLPNEKVQFALETEKALQTDFRIKTGLEYQILKPLILRVGAATNPPLFTFGVGTEVKGLHIDFASSWHLQLGYSPQFALRYQFGNSKEDE